MTQVARCGGLQPRDQGNYLPDGKIQGKTMSSDCFEIKAFINDVWEDTVESIKQETEDHGLWSRIWIDRLGRGFQEYYRDKDDKYRRVFWKGNVENRKEFGLNELLFDIAVCSVSTTISIVRGTLLEFVSGCYWQVESELDNKNSRKITQDFSKLVMGSSHNKLFVSSYQHHRQDSVLRMCSDIAAHCDGNLYLCFIDHPQNWKENPQAPVVYEWADGGCWKRL